MAALQIVAVDGVQVAEFAEVFLTMRLAKHGLTAEADRM